MVVPAPYQNVSEAEMRRLVVAASIFWVSISGCMPNTYYSIDDPYAYGLRWHDRGNYDQAAKYWDPLVENGDCDAEVWVAKLYFLGQGKPQSNDKALELWHKAANGNHPKAQAAMGDLCYQNESVIYIHCVGCTVKKDLVQAYVWYKLSEKSARYDAEKGYIESVLKSITLEMSKEQIEAGNKAVAQWQPTPKDCKPRNWW